MGVMAIVFAVWHVSAVVVDLTTILLCASSERRSRTAYVILPTARGATQPTAHRHRAFFTREHAVRVFDGVKEVCR